VKNGPKSAVGVAEIDITALNDHIKALINGETVVSPVINVKANSRKMRTIKGKPLYVIIIEGVYCDRLKNKDMTVYFDIGFDQLRNQRSKKEDVVLYPKGDAVRTLLEDISRLEHDYLMNTDIPSTSELKINGKYEILMRTPSKDSAIV